MPAPVVLLVEDHAELRAVLKEAFSSEGYDVLVARDEAEALDVLRGSRVDLLISDPADRFATPTGLEAIRSEFPDLQVVALSASAAQHPDVFLGARQAPRGVRTLPKPFSLGQLLAVSREVLGALG